jgi:predicted kinase
MAPLIIDILRAGASVVLDFAENRIDERAWARTLPNKLGVRIFSIFLTLMKRNAYVVS